MKKVLCILMAALMLTLCACGGGEGGGQTAETTTAAAEATFMVGYHKVNITPEDSVPMGGYNKPSERMSTGYNDYLYATVCAITDANGETAILIGIDLTSSYSRVSHDIRDAIVKEHGIPFENILYSASHMHTGPDLNSDKMTVIAKYKKQLQEWVVHAVGAALEDRKPATMYIGSTQTEGLNFVRRYLMNDGTYAGDNFGDYSSGYKEHETEADGQLQLIKFVREGDNDVLLANFQTHPHRASSATSTALTADLVGVFRTELENQLGIEVCYFSGAGGNINPKSRITEENITADYKEQGAALAKYAVDAYDTLTQAATGEVKSRMVTVTYNTDHSDDHLLDVAKDLYTRYNKDQLTAAEVKELGKEYGIQGTYHAGAIVGKADEGRTRDFEHYTIAIGDVAFVGAPEEMFDTNGKQIKEGSPYKMTFILTYCNGSNGYIPSELAWEHGGYEVYKTKFARGTAELIVDQFLNMLNDMYNN